MTSSCQLQDLDQYLARHCFAPNPGNSAWLDRDTGQQIIRVLHEPGETTLLYRRAPHRSCLYEAVFSPGTPDTVIIAAIEAALSRPAPGRPEQNQVGHKLAWESAAAQDRVLHHGNAKLQLDDSSHNAVLLESSSGRARLPTKEPSYERHRQALDRR